MIKILGMAKSGERCDWTAATKDVVRFKSVGGTLGGNICWDELLRIVKRKSQEQAAQSTNTPKTPRSDKPAVGDTSDP